MTSLLYLLFFCSGLSGLIYQVVWVRVFGNVFGNTIYSASIVIAVFMLGLGAGGYIVGAWADRRYADRPESLVRAYGFVELLIGLMGLAVSALLPHLGQLSADVSSYSRGANGWYALSLSSYLARGAIAIALLSPITVLMGGTLTLLIRHLVRSDAAIEGRRIAVLYGVNTAGAALGCFLTDFTLVPAVGLRATQYVAVFFNLLAAFGALLLAARARPMFTTAGAAPLQPHREGTRSAGRRSTAASHSIPSSLAWTGLALAFSGFAAMGMEIVWFRHFTLLLGVFRAVYSLLLTVILLGIGAGSLAGAFLLRRTQQPAAWLIAVQGLFVAATLLGLANADVRGLAVTARGVESTIGSASAAARTLAELWFNARPIVVEVGLPALLMGFAFPLANAMIQRAEQSVGRRAGLLYLANTVGAVCGSLAAGFLLLPAAGIQRSATILAVVAWLAVVPLAAATRTGRRASTAALAGATLVSGAAIWLWLLLPPEQVMAQALLLPADDEIVALDEGIAEVITVADDRDGRRWLLTNGHPMSSTGPFDQRYMRALAHIPLLCLDNPSAVLVIGFGVGNTTQAATLHPSVRRVEVADLSRDILNHSSYFADVNRDVLRDPRVAVYVNDGRQHLQLQPAASYDLIALEPPPIAHAGVGALYSREFYALARSRLKSRGYISQWLPAYQVPAATTLAMIRAFVEVFPHSVLLSGAEPNLQLLGTNDSRIEIDPAMVANALSKAPAVQADLRRVDLGTVREIVGTFVGSARTLADASRGALAATDDRPAQEYSVRSLLNTGAAGVPSTIVDVSRVAEWCPRCVEGGKPVPLVAGLDTYLALLARAYMVPDGDAATNAAEPAAREMIKGSSYLATVLRKAAGARNDRGVALVTAGKVDEAIAEFESALRLEPDLAVARRNLTTAREVRLKESK